MWDPSLWFPPNTCTGPGWLSRGAADTSVQLGAMLWPRLHSTMPPPSPRKGVVSLPSVMMFWVTPPGAPCLTESSTLEGICKLASRNGNREHIRGPGTQEAKEQGPMRAVAAASKCSLWLLWERTTPLGRVPRVEPGWRCQRRRVEFIGRKNVVAPARFQERASWYRVPGSLGFMHAQASRSMREEVDGWPWT